MRSIYTYYDLMRENLEVESSETYFVNEDWSLNLTRVQDLAVHLLATAQVTQEDVQSKLDAIDEPTEELANDKAFGIFNEVLASKRKHLLEVLGLPREQQ